MYWTLKQELLVQALPPTSYGKFEQAYPLLCSLFLTMGNEKSTLDVSLISLLLPKSYDFQILFSNCFSVSNNLRVERDLNSLAHTPTRYLRHYNITLMPNGHLASSGILQCSETHSFMVVHCNTADYYKVLKTHKN